MSDLRTILERGVGGATPPPDGFERMLHRRDRKRRNQRIAAGIVGIAVFVAAVWIVTSGLSLDRSEKSVAPAGEVTGPAETAPPSATAPAAPDVVRTRTCSDGARYRLELTDMGDRIKVRFEVHRSPVGHEWHIRFRHLLTPCCEPFGDVFFHTTRVASDSRVFVVELRYPDRVEFDGLFGSAKDTQTVQVCRVWVHGP